jgi:hypothetical protein
MGTRSASLAALAGLLTGDGAGNVLANQSPAQFDNSLKLATTASVKAAGMQAAGIVVITGSQSIVAANAGSTIIGGSGTAITATLPAASSVPVGARFEFINPSTGAMTVQRAGSDNIRYQSGNATSGSLGNGDSLVLESDGVSVWFVTGGTIQAVASPLFAASLGTPGYQKLPSGLIIQWGTTVVPANSVVGTITLPIAMPNIIIAASLTGQTPPGAAPVGIVATSKSTLNTQTPGGNSVSSYYIVIGY